MKPYQHHDPIADKGKALPHPKRPTLHTYRGSRFRLPVTMDRNFYRTSRERSVKPVAGRGPVQTLGIVATIAALLGIRLPRGRRGV